jgi:hypothetical protein
VAAIGAGASLREARRANDYDRFSWRAKP